MPYLYQYQNLRTLVREYSGQNSQGMRDERALINQVVREVGSEIDLRSTKRRALLSPRLTAEYDYTAPSNMKPWGIIDVQKQHSRKTRQVSEWILTTPEEFDRHKTLFPNLVTMVEFDGQQIVRLSGEEDDNKLIINAMDGVSDNGTWSVDSDNTASNDLDTSTSADYTGSAHLVWDVDTTGTSATIQNSTMTAVDIRSFKRDRGYIYLRQYIPVTSASERAKITSFRLQIGSDSGNRYQDTTTTGADGLSFTEGLNVLRFNFPLAAAAGTPVDTAIDYVRLELVLSSAFLAEETGWRTDNIVARQGKVHQVYYYTNFLWDCGAARVSVGDTDLVSAFEEEMELFALKGAEKVSRSARDFDRARELRAEYKEKKKEYLMNFPSERKLLTTTYHYLGDSTEDLKDQNVNDTSE